MVDAFAPIGVPEDYRHTVSAERTANHKPKGKFLACAITHDFCPRNIFVIKPWRTWRSNHKFLCNGFEAFACCECA